MRKHLVVKRSPLVSAARSAIVQKVAHRYSSSDTYVSQSRLIDTIPRFICRGRW